MKSIKVIIAVIMSAMMITGITQAYSTGYMIIPKFVKEHILSIDNERLLTEYTRKILKRGEYRQPEQEPVQNSPVMRYLGIFKITGYDTCSKCCGKTDGITASGTVATVGRTCAVSGFEFGTKLYIEGIGERIVEDRGGSVKGNHIDVLCEDHEACFALTGNYDVYIVEG